MESLKEYVKSEFYELNKKEWSNTMIKEFIKTAANRDSDVLAQIQDVDYDELKDIIADFDLSYV
ncbi:unnamed protein product, partial [marine sediment metagenome]